jgi:hypothetical protein
MAIDLNLTNINPNNPLAIYQGATYKSLVFFHPQDLSLWTPRGQIRTNWLRLDGELLADFLFLPLTFGTVVLSGLPHDRTTIVPILSHQITQLIPATRPVLNNEAPKVGKNAWVYDLELVSPSGSEVLKLARGLVEVLPEATGVI